MQNSFSVKKIDSGYCKDLEKFIFTQTGMLYKKDNYLLKFAEDNTEVFVGFHIDAENNDLYLQSCLVDSVNICSQFH